MTSIDDVMIEITPQVLLKAYACGIFPMAESAEDNALYWIEPERRGILPLDRVHVPRGSPAPSAQGGFEVRIDNDFDDGHRGLRRAACRPADRPGLTAASAASMRDLFALGHCHTVEVWEAGRSDRRPLRGASRPRVFRREHVLQGPRRQQDRARLSRRPSQISAASSCSTPSS